MIFLYIKITETKTDLQNIEGLEVLYDTKIQ